MLILRRWRTANLLVGFVMVLGFATSGGAAPVADELEHGAPPAASGPTVRPAGPLYAPQGATLPGAGGVGGGQSINNQGAGPAAVTGSSNSVGRATAQAAGAGSVELNPYDPLGDEHAAWRNPVAAPGQVAPGVRLLRMRDNMVGVIHTRAYKLTMIRLPACEEVTIATVGESNGFIPKVPAISAGGGKEAVARGIPLNEVELATKVSGSDTSLHVRTRSGRLYAFQIFAEHLDSTNVSDLTVLVEHDGACAQADGDPVGGRSAAPAPDFVRSIPFDAKRLRFDAYRAFGESPAVAWLAPDILAFDGMWLFIDYGRRADLISKPVALNVVEGVPSPAQQEWVGQDSAMLVVKSPADLVMLQSGNSFICIRRVVDTTQPLGNAFVIDPSLGRR